MGLGTRNAYKAALARRRCIIPADAFYEWQVRERERERERGQEEGQTALCDPAPKWLFPLAFAGLWEFWRDRDDPDAEPLRSCVMITTEANKLLAPIHDRMPVILPPKAWDQWLDPGNEDVKGLQKLLVPAPAKEFEAYPVSTRVNNVPNGGPELIEPNPEPSHG